MAKAPPEESFNMDNLGTQTLFKGESWGHISVYVYITFEYTGPLDEASYEEFWPHIRSGLLLRRLSSLLGSPLH